MKNDGLALIELLIVIVIIFTVVVMFGFYGGIMMGNFWVGEESALKAVQRIDPTAIEVVGLNRNVWRYSVVTIRDENGAESQFGIDANILQNRTAHRK